jgi:N utilization substance protein B
MSQLKTNARKCAVQALYQWQMSGETINHIETYFLEEELLKGAQKTYFSEILHGVPRTLDVIDAALTEFIDRPVEKIDPVERAILRIGVYELINRLETPYKVIINEGVNLAKFFGAEGSHKYINGILDKVCQKLRAVEIAAKAAKTGK